MLRLIFPECETSRFASKMVDDMGIDFVNTADLAIQSKTLKSNPNLVDVFERMNTKDKKVFIYKNNRVHGPQGEYAVMPLREFLSLLVDVYGESL